MERSDFLVVMISGAVKEGWDDLVEITKGVKLFDFKPDLDCY